MPAKETNTLELTIAGRAYRFGPMGFRGHIRLQQWLGKVPRPAVDYRGMMEAAIGATEAEFASVPEGDRARVVEETRAGCFRLVADWSTEERLLALAWPPRFGSPEAMHLLTGSADGLATLIAEALRVHQPDIGEAEIQGVIDHMTAEEFVEVVGVFVPRDRPDPPKPSPNPEPTQAETTAA